MTEFLVPYELHELYELYEQNVKVPEMIGLFLHHCQAHCKQVQWTLTCWNMMVHATEGSLSGSLRVDQCYFDDYSAELDHNCDCAHW